MLSSLTKIYLNRLIGGKNNGAAFDKLPKRTLYEKY